MTKNRLPGKSTLCVVCYALLSSFFCLLAPLGLVAEEVTAIDWQTMYRQDDLVTREMGYWPGAKNDIILETGESVKVLNRSNRLLRVEFIGLTDDDERSDLAEARLQALVSESPGSAAHFEFNQTRSELLATSRERIVQLTNQYFQSVRFRVLEGEPMQLQPFAPISWLGEEQNHISTHFDNHQYQTWLAAQAPGALALEKETFYWQESMMTASERAALARNQFWLWYSEGKTGEELVREIIAYEATSQKRLVTDLTPEKSEHTLPLRPMLPTLFAVSESGEWRQDSSGDGLYRVQSVSADWLFSDNYDRYGAPALQQFQNNLQLTQGLVSLHQHSENLTWQPAPLHHASQRQAINRQLVNKSLKGTVASSGKGEAQGEILQERFLIPRQSVWDFDAHREPDLLPQGQAVSIDKNRKAFILLQPEESIAWQRPEDLLSNELTLEIHWPAATGQIVVLVDGKKYQTLVPFPVMPQFSRTTDWQRVPQGQDRTLHGQAEQHINKDVSVERLLLPDRWQSIKVSAQAIEQGVGKQTPGKQTAGQQTASLIRLSYKTYREFQLDGPQWQKLLSAESDLTSIARFKQYSPQWQAYQTYLRLKLEEYQHHEIPTVLRHLLTSGQVNGALFDAKIPTSLPYYQAIQDYLMQPKLNSWLYWQDFAQALRQGGWDNYAATLMRAVLMYHQDRELQKSAAQWLLTLHAEEQNHVAVTSLLIYLHQSDLQQNDNNDNWSLQLAAWFLQHNQLQRALFVLVDTRPSWQRSQLIHQAATRSGFLALAKKFTPEPGQDNGGFAPETGTDITGQLISGITSKDKIQLRNIQLNLLQSNYLVTPESPVSIRVSQGATLQLLARQWFEYSDADTSHQDHDWLKVSFGSTYGAVPLFYSDYRSPTLVNSRGLAGQGHRMIVTTPESGIVELKTTQGAAIVHITETVAAHQIQPYAERCTRAMTRSPHKLFQFNPEAEADEFVCHGLQYLPSEAKHFRLISTDGWAVQPQGKEAVRLLQEFEAQPDSAKLARLNQLLNQWPESNTKVRFLRRLNRSTRWQALGNPVSVKKFNQFHSKTNAPISPAAFRNRLLFVPYQPGWEKLSRNTALNYELRVAENQEFRLLVEAQQHLFSVGKGEESLVAVQVNETAQNIVPLTAGEMQIIPLNLTAGSHQISLLQVSDNVPESVIAKLQFRQSGEPWQEQPLEIRLRLFQADEKQPYTTFLTDASWLRIDSFNEAGLAWHEYRYAPKGMFHWHPRSSEYIGHRIYRLMSAGDKDAEEVPGMSEVALTVPDKVTAGKEVVKPGSYYVKPLESEPTAWKEQNQHSWGAWLSKRQRRFPDEEAVQNNRYLELGAYSQSHEPDVNEAIRYQFSTRLYDGELQDSFHARVDWWDTQWADHFDLNLGLSFAGQEGMFNSDFAWSAQIRGDLHWQYSINRRFFNRFSGQLWANILASGDAVRLSDLRQYASAVYSQYKLDHRHGIRLADSLRYKWHHDMESWFNMQLNSNPLGQSDFIDNAVAELGTRLFYRGLAVDLTWRYQAFVNDEDRARSIKDSRLGIGFDWFYWRKKDHLRWRLDYQRNLLTDENYWTLGFSYNRSGKRGVQDYLPQSLAFSALRQQEAVLTAMEPDDD